MAKKKLKKHKVHPLMQRFQPKNNPKVRFAQHIQDMFEEVQDRGSWRNVNE